MGNGFTINAEQTRKQYTPTAGVVEFAIPWEFFDNDDIEVYFDDATTPESSGYTVAGERDGTPGNRHVTFAVAPETSGVALLTIVLNMTIERSSAFSTSADFTAAAVDDDFDRQVLIAKQIDEKSGRYLSYPVTIADAVSAVLPDPATEGGNFLKFAEDGLSVEAQSLRAGGFCARNPVAGAYSSGTAIPFASETYDALGEFDGTTWTSSIAGTYGITSRIEGTGIAGANVWTSGYRIQNNNDHFSGTLLHGEVDLTGGASHTWMTSLILPFEAGATVVLNCNRSSGSGDITIAAGSYYIFTVSYLGPLPAGL